jgi:plasmid stability protein
MKNVTLSLPDDLLAKSREYAKEHNTSINQMIRDFLTSSVMKKQQNALDTLFEHMDSTKVEMSEKWTREELYER